MRVVKFTFERLMFCIFSLICLAHLCLFCLALVWFSHYVSKCLVNNSCTAVIWPLVFGAVIFVVLWWLSAFMRLYKFCKSQGVAATTSEPTTNYVAVSNHLFKGAYTHMMSVVAFPKSRQNN